ncbi:MAG TPA: choice-of-anchor tandem repeat GloVer-containing protein [Rhizomicrobium sp.]|nr:choice-of-anchor tandem repeat GloVer-containing protein [Rhizomicrobium sp.]
MSRNFARSVFVCGLSLAAGLWSAQAEAGAIVNYHVLHDFCQATSCADGGLPIGAPAIDANGDLFGVSTSGGRFGSGVLYELVPKHGGARYFKHVLKAFCDPDYCGGGGEPEAGPMLDVSGNVYGTTSGFVQKMCGAVYMKSAERQLHVLHAFQGTDGCHPGSGSLDYQGRESGQVYDGVSPLYGMTSKGGSNSEGVVYELTPPKPGHNKWSERVLYSFCQISDCADGTTPQGNLVMDANGDLFGATSDNTIFELTPDGAGGFNHTILYISATGESVMGLALASDGTTLYGIASTGGGATARGTLFSLAQGSCRACGARQTVYQYTLLHDFCPSGANCTDGAGPAAIVLDSQDDIFGVTQSGGANASPVTSPPGAGTVFEYTHAGSFLTLYNFCAQASCADGAVPFGGGLLINNGALYGTTGLGGSTASGPIGAGVVFELTLP